MAKSTTKPAPKSATKALAKPAPKPAATKPASPPVAKPAPKPAAKAAPAPPTPTAPAPFVRTTGLSPKEQRLQALRAKLAHTSSGAKPLPGASAQSFSAKSFTGKKTPFQRKAV
jgi:translation initiation factor IF-2